MIYDFKVQVADDRQNIACKAVADYWRELGYEVMDVSHNENYFTLGIDLIRSIAGMEETRIDVKCDFQAHATGNVPVELIEVVGLDRANKIGWAYKDSLDEIHFYVWEDKIIYPIKRKTLLNLAFQDGRRGYASFHEKPFPYFTLGILVPIEELKKHQSQNEKLT